MSAAGLRVDGRRPREVRRVRCRLGLFARVDGSAYFEQGNTKVIAVVYGPRETPIRSKAQHDRAIINCEYSMAPFSTSERRKRRPGDRRSLEVTVALKQTFESVVMTHLYPRSQIDIFVQVIQADGDTVCPCINAATLALIHAGVSMKDFVVACSAGYLEKTPLLDLNFMESSSTGPMLPVAILPRTNQVMMVTMDSRLSLPVFKTVFDLAMEGCHQVHGVVQGAVREHAFRVAAVKSQWETRHLRGDGGEEGGEAAGDMVDRSAFGAVGEEDDGEEGGVRE